MPEGRAKQKGRLQRNAEWRAARSPDAATSAGELMLRRHGVRPFVQRTTDMALRWPRMLQIQLLHFLLQPLQQLPRPAGRSPQAPVTGRPAFEVAGASDKLLGPRGPRRCMALAPCHAPGQAEPSGSGDRPARACT